MRTSSIYRVFVLLIVATLVLTSCKVPGPTTPASTEPTNDEAIAPTETLALEEITETVEPTPTVIPPTEIPIVENRLPPERWQEWPVVPELTGREKSIYQYGLALGNDPHSFSKVGDCQAIKQVLMGLYDQPGRYTITDENAYLQEAIANFSGSFDRDGQGVRGGFNAAAVLSPIWADPEVCQPGENPIECENRVHNPSFVIISLEVWWEGRTVERYEEYMRTIIEYYIDNGVVPILSTKADNVEGGHRINLATAQLAYEYHIPLWNFWLAVQSMPYQGIDPNRDGFHISYDAWTVRSFTALQALDAVWRGVRDEMASDVTPIATPTPDVAFADVAISPAPVSPAVATENQRLIFSLEQRSGEASQNLGVFTYDMATQTLYQVLEAGYQLQDADPTGSKLLASQGNKLFISDPTGTISVVTDKLAITGRNASAYWLPDDVRLLVLTDEGDNQTVSLVDPVNDTWTQVATGQISGLVKPAGDTAFYWYQGECTAEAACEENTIWTNGPDGPIEYLANTNFTMAQNGQSIAWVESTEDPTQILYTSSVDKTNQDFLYLPGNRAVDLEWSPDSTSVVLLSKTRDDYTGKSGDARIFLVNTTTMSQTEFYAFPGLTPSVIWSAGAGQLFLTSTLPTDDGYQLHFRQMDLGSGLFDNLDNSLSITSPDFITLDKIYWITP
jgi:hypothetical protein